MAEYGFAPAFLAAHPDVKAKVDAATAGGWTQDAFLDALKTTTWWKSNTDSQRRFDVLVYENPREITSQVERMIASIQRMLTTMGMGTSFGIGTISRWANTAVRGGWNETELRYFLGTQFSHGGNQGLIGSTRAALTALAADYGVSMSTGGMNNAIETILQGVNTVEDYRATMIAAAKTLFPATAQALDAGATIKSLMDPYLQIASQELGRPATTMSITDPLWNAALTYRGEKPVSATPQHMMSQDEWVRTIRTDVRYGYDTSETAQKAASTLTNGLAQLMGAMG